MISFFYQNQFAFLFGVDVGSLGPEALDRFIYRKGGMDFGPFSVQGIYEQIRLHNVDANTEIKSVRKGTWKKLSEYPLFKEYLEKWAKEEAELKKREEVIKEAEKIERRLKYGGRLPYIFVVMVLAGSGIGAYLLLKPEKTPSRGYPVSFYVDLSFPALSVLSPEIKTEEQTTKKEQKIVKKISKTTGSSGKEEESDFEPIDISLEEDKSGGREITQTEIDAIQKAVTPKIIECFVEEAKRNPDLLGGKVTLYIKTDGTTVISRVDAQPSTSKELKLCCKNSASDVPKIQPFAPPNRVMTIPVHVGSTK